MIFQSLSVCCHVCVDTDNNWTNGTHKCLCGVYIPPNDLSTRIRIHGCVFAIWFSVLENLAEGKRYHSGIPWASKHGMSLPRPTWSQGSQHSTSTPKKLFHHRSHHSFIHFKLKFPSHTRLLKPNIKPIRTKQDLTEWENIVRYLRWIGRKNMRETSVGLWFDSFWFLQMWRGW